MLKYLECELKIIDFAEWKGHCVFCLAYWQGWCSCCMGLGIHTICWLLIYLYSGGFRLDSWLSCMPWWLVLGLYLEGTLFESWLMICTGEVPVLSLGLSIVTRDARHVFWTLPLRIWAQLHVTVFRKESENFEFRSAGLEVDTVGSHAYTRTAWWSNNHVFFLWKGKYSKK